MKISIFILLLLAGCADHDPHVMEFQSVSGDGCECKFKVDLQRETPISISPLGGIK